MTCIGKCFPRLTLSRVLDNPPQWRARQSTLSSATTTPCKQDKPNLDNLWLSLWHREEWRNRDLDEGLSWSIVMDSRVGRDQYYLNRTNSHIHIFHSKRKCRIIRRDWMVSQENNRCMLVLLLFKTTQYPQTSCLQNIMRSTWGTSQIYHHGNHDTKSTTFMKCRYVTMSNPSKWFSTCC